MNTVTINTTPQFPLSPRLYMQFMEPLGTADTSVDAAWDFLHHHWRPEVVAMTRKLAPGMIRWGGCFASYYRWREAVGPLGGRVPMLNLCWDGVHMNEVGTREFVEFCRMADTEPLMVVNMESDGRMQWAYPAPGMDRFGTAQEAADWVRYCNDPDDALRRAHDPSGPYNIKYWQIGNETSYDKKGYGAERTAKVTLDFAKKMRQADPSIKLIAWGDDGFTPRILEEAGEWIDQVAFHHHFNSGLPDSPLKDNEYRKDLARTWEHLMHAHASLSEHIAKMRDDLGGSIKHKLAMTEGHFGLPGRDRCDVLSTWAAGVAYARCLNVQSRNGDIIDIATMADFCGNRWQVNALMIPTPMRPNSKLYFQPVGQVMALFGGHIGTHAAEASAPSNLDITASVTGNRVFLHVANTSLTDAATVRFEIPNASITGGKAYEIAADPWHEITELTPDCFDPVQKKIEGSEWTFPAASVTAVELDLAL